MKFVLATHNPNKIREMGAILGQFGVEVVSPKDLGITVDVEETGSTFAENAMLKAKAICELACYWKIWVWARARNKQAAARPVTAPVTREAPSRMGR